MIDRCYLQTAHAAYVKTMLAIHKYYVWPGIRKNVKTYLSHCQVCRTITPPPEQSIRGKVPVPPRPFHTWFSDRSGKQVRAPLLNRSGKKVKVEDRVLKLQHLLLLCHRQDKQQLYLIRQQCTPLTAAVMTGGRATPRSDGGQALLLAIFCRWSHSVDLKDSLTVEAQVFCHPQGTNYPLY